MSNYSGKQVVGKSGCESCSRFDNNNCDSCLIKIKTMNCDPNNWKDKSDGSNGGSLAAPVGVDPVRSNIYNGGWLCNYEPYQVQNSVYCQRQFFDAHIRAPYNVGCRVNAESRLRGITTYGNRFCAKADSSLE